LTENQDHDHKWPDWMPELKFSKQNDWVCCDDMAMGRTTDHLVVVKVDRMTTGSIRAAITRGRSELNEDLCEAGEGAAFYLSVEEIGPDGNTTELNSTIIIPASYIS